jgi:hypothetical protein
MSKISHINEPQANCEAETWDAAHIGKCFCTRNPKHPGPHRQVRVIDGKREVFEWINGSHPFRVEG